MWPLSSVFIAVIGDKSWGGLKGGRKENGYILVWQSTRNVIYLPLRDLKAQIEALKTVEDKTTHQTDQPTYEVYTRTEAAKFAHLSKVCCPQRGSYPPVCVCVWLWHIAQTVSQLSEVEERLARLESLVGNEDMTVVSAWREASQWALHWCYLSLYRYGLCVMTEICLTSQSTVAAGLDAEHKDLSVSTDIHWTNILSKHYGNAEDWHRLIETLPLTFIC